MKEEVFYKHGRRNLFHKDYTVCGKVVEADPGFTDEDAGYIVPPIYELHIGVAVCHLTDTFTKKVGTKLAYERATTNPVLKIALKGDRSYHQYKALVDEWIPQQALNIVLEVNTGVKTY